MKYLGFIASRALQTLISMWVLATLTFFLFKIFPGSPYDDEISLHPSVQEQVDSYYGLQQPLLTQYAHFLKNLGSGKFGVSQFFPGRDASEVILDTFPTTLILAALALTLALAVAFLIAIWSEVSRIGHFVFEAVTLGSLSLPLLLSGPLLIYVFGFYWNLLPVALLEKPSSYILPVIVISLKPIASLGRILQASLQENSTLEFLRTARAFGFSKKKILLKHNLRNALIPLISYLGPLAAFMLTGSTMVEIIFAIPGLGSQFVESVLNRDSSMVLGLTVFYGFFIFTFQLLVDLGVGILDPRARAR